MDEDEEYRTLAKQHGLPFAPLERPPTLEVANHIPHHIAERHTMVAIEQSDNRLVVAMADPSNVLAVDDVNLMTGFDVAVVVSTPGAIRRAIGEAYLPEDDFPALLGDIITPSHQAPGVRPPVAPREEQLRDLFFEVLDRAFETGACELVLEPLPGHLRVLMRTSRYFCPMTDVSGSGVPTLLRIVGELLQMDLSPEAPPTRAEVPIRRNEDARQVLVRTLPNAAGPRVHLRLLPDAPPLAERSRELLQGRAGLEVFVGPTPASRASRLDYELTTLMPRSYSICGVAAGEVPRRAGAFLADPGERDLAELLTAAVDQDPDVLVLDLPDSTDATRLALAEAQAGRLVLVTAQGRSPRAGVEHLLRAGIRPGPIASRLNTIHYEHIVGILCPRCRVPDRAGTALIEGLEVTLGPPPEAWPGPEGARPYQRGPGCPDCQRTGYQGTQALVRTISIDDGLRADIRAERWGALQAPGREAFLAEVRRLALAGRLAPNEVLGTG